MPDTQPSLFPEPEAVPIDGGIRIGTRRGDLEALHAAARNVEVWCGPTLGWRPYAEPVGSADCIVIAYGRLTGGPSYDMGPVAPVLDEEEPDDAAD